MVRYVLDAATQENVRATIVVVGHHATWVQKELSEVARPDVPLTFVEQDEQLGTGHAVRVALSTVADAIGDSDGDVLILPGDTPLLRRSTVAHLLTVHREQVGHGRASKEGGVARQDQHVAVAVADG